MSEEGQMDGGGGDGSGQMVESGGGGGGDGGENGGSFWSAFGIRFGSDACPFDEIFERDDMTLEDILGHEEVIQECKYLNTTLIDYLCTKSVMEKFIDYIVMVEPPAEGKDAEQKKKEEATAGAAAAAAAAPAAADSKDDDEKKPAAAAAAASSAPAGTKASAAAATATESSSADSKSGAVASAGPTKYSYIVSELFACEVVGMLDVLFKHEELLVKLFSFLDRPPPLDPAGVGYFRKVVMVLIQREFDELIAWVKGKGVIDKLIQHIGLYSMMQLLIMMGWDDGLDRAKDVNWLYDEGMIPKMVARLDPKFGDMDDVHMNVAQALVDLVVKTAVTDDNKLITHLQSDEMLSEIFKHMFSGSVTSLRAGLAIVRVLLQRDTNRIEVEAEVAATAAAEAADGGAAAAPASTPSGGSPAVVALVTKHLPQIKKVLMDPPDAKQLDTQFATLNKTVGDARMKALGVVLELFRGDHESVHAELVKQGFIPVLLDLFLEFGWNNMLHAVTESIIVSIVENPDGAKLREALFKQADFINFLQSAFEENKLSASSGKGLRLGYMGHLIRMTNAVVAAMGREEKFAETYVPDQKEWISFAATYLEPENAKHAIQLGGYRPATPDPGGEEDYEEENEDDEFEEDSLINGYQFDPTLPGNDSEFTFTTYGQDESDSDEDVNGGAGGSATNVYPSPGGDSDDEDAVSYVDQ